MTNAICSCSQCAQNALEDMCNFLSDEGEVAIFDATNTTRDRRRLIYNYCTQTFCFRVFFVESICDSPEIIGANIRVCQRASSFFFLYELLNTTGSQTQKSRLQGCITSGGR
jgi:hypothetical protein